MKKLLLVVLGLVALPALALAQPQDCPTCVLGLWDDTALSSNYGTVTTGVMKDIYLGLKLSGTETGTNTIEFSIFGMRSDTDGIVVTGTEWTVMPAVTLGPSINAPADSSQSSTGVGGITIAWAGCLTPPVGESNLIMARITFLSFAPVTNKVFTVMHKFPTSNTLYNFKPVLVRCDTEFTSVRISGGCYVANWDGSTVLPCDRKTSVQTTSWSAVKQLFN